MESFREQARWILLGLTLAIFSVVSAAAQDSVSSSSETKTSQAVSASSSNSTAPCRETGNWNPPSLALTPDQWPSTYQGQEDDQFNSLKTYCPNKDDYFLVPPRCPWYVRMEGGGLHRSTTHGVEFQAQAVNLQTVGNTVVGGEVMALGTGLFNYDFAGAGHLLIGHTINENLQIEASYLGSAKTTNSQAVRDPQANLYSPFSNFGFNTPITGLDNNTFASIRYESSLQGGEINLRRQIPMPPEQLTVSALIGVRYLTLPEKLSYHTTCAAGSADILVDSGNEMVGPQIGALCEFYVQNRWWINFEAKAGLMNNRGRQRTDYTIVGGSYAGTGSNSVDEDHTSFVGDLNLTCVYRWSPHFNTRLGYQAIWITDVVLAQNNFDTNIDILTQGPAQLNHSQNIIYHGPFAGLEFSW